MHGVSCDRSGSNAQSKRSATYMAAVDGDMPSSAFLYRKRAGPKTSASEEGAWNDKGLQGERRGEGGGGEGGRWRGGNE